MLFKLDLGQISFNLVENVFATQQLAFLVTSIAFYHIVTRVCTEIKILRKMTRKWPTSLGFSIFGFFCLLFFSFSFLFAGVIHLLLGLLAVKKRLRKEPGVVAGNFALSFLLNFLRIFVYTCISGSIRPITLIWASLERAFPQQKLSIDDANFGQKW